MGAGTAANTRARGENLSPLRPSPLAKSAPSAAPSSLKSAVQSPSKRGARRATAEARRRAILAAALTVFASHGFAAARLDDVAARAGVAKGTLYLYFRDKEALFEALVRSAVAPLNPTTGVAFASSAIADISAVVGPMSAFAAIAAAAVQVNLTGPYSVLVPTITASATGVAFIAGASPVPVQQFAFDVQS